MFKKKDPKSLVVSPASSYTDLLDAARRDEARKWTKYEIPRPWQIWRLVGTDPCGMVNCATNGDHIEVRAGRGSLLVALLLGTFMAITVIAFLTKDFGFLATFWYWLIPVATSLAFIWIAAYPSWFAHKRELQEAIPEKNPENLLRDFLRERFDQIQIAVLGDGALVRILRNKMEDQLVNARRIREQMAKRLGQRPQGEHKKLLQGELESMDDVISRLDVSKRALEVHIAELEASFAESREELDGVASDLPLMQEARALTQEAEASINRADETVERSLADVQRRLLRLQEETTRIFGGADTLFTQRVRLSADLTDFDRRLAMATGLSISAESEALAGERQNVGK